MRYSFLKVFIPALTFLFLTPAFSQTVPLRLWYDSPAKNWMTEALPIGNGYLGVMFFGDPAEERLQFSEGTLWAGGKNANKEYNFGLRKDAYKNLPEVRKLLAQGKLEEAHKLANKELTGTIHEKKENTPSSDFGAQQTMGDLYITVSHKGEIKNYRRELNISDATGKSKLRSRNLKI